MTLNDLIQAQGQAFADRVFEKDPNASVKITNPKIRTIANSMHMPVADILVSTGGNDYKYSLTRDQFTGKFSTIPFIEQ